MQRLQAETAFRLSNALWPRAVVKLRPVERRGVRNGDRARGVDTIVAMQLASH